LKEVEIMLGSFGWQELLLILAIVLVVFGAKKLPEIGRAIGKTLTEFKKGIKEAKRELEKEETEEKVKELEKEGEDKSG